jgi:hypothetical protein
VRTGVIVSYTENTHIVLFAGFELRGLTLTHNRAAVPASRGKPRLYKCGGKNLPDMLYMCTTNAMKPNTACKALYEQLRVNGKTGKQALIVYVVV